LCADVYLQSPNIEYHKQIKLTGIFPIVCEEKYRDGALQFGHDRFHIIPNSALAVSVHYMALSEGSDEMSDPAQSRGSENPANVQYTTSSCLVIGWDIHPLHPLKRGKLLLVGPRNYVSSFAGSQAVFSSAYDCN
jgi:hypothetical protein